MKDIYEAPMLLITEFATEDVITGSTAGSENETPGDDL